MSKLIKRLFWTLAFTVLGLVFLAIIIAAFFEKQIGDQILKSVNKQITTELTVEEFNLSLLSGFPKVSANLNQVVLKDPDGGNLLEADLVAFRFGLLSLLSSDIQVHSVLIQDGAMNVQIDRKGRGNFDVIKASTNSDSEGASSGISLDEALLENIELIYENDQTKQNVRLYIQEAMSSGQFSAEEFELISFAEMRSDFIEIGQDRYFVGEKLLYDADIAVNLKDGTYELNNVDLGIASNVFKVTGLVEQTETQMNLDLHFASEESSLKVMLDLLPEKYQAYFSDFDSRGKFKVKAAVKGPYSKSKMPSIKTDFALRDGRISSPRMEESLKDVTLAATFYSPAGKSTKNAKFEIRQLTGYFNRELFDAKMRVTNLDDPKIQFFLDGVLPVKSFYGLLNNPAITDGSGEVEIKRLKIDGMYKDMITPSRIGRVKTSGALEFDDVAMTINEEDIMLDRGMLKLSDNNLEVTDLKFEGAGTDLKLSGDFLNLLPVLLADQGNTKKAKLKYKATLKGESLDIDRLMSIIDVPVNEETLARKSVEEADSIVGAKLELRQRITDLLEGSFQADIDEWNYELIEGEDFSGSLVFKDKKLLIKGDTKGMEGKFNIDGEMKFKPRPALEAKLSCEGINLKTFFYQGKNFGQEVLQHDHVDGTLKSNMLIEAYWDSKGNFMEDQLHVLADVMITNGRVKDFDLFYDFSSVIKLDDLRDIRFSDARNWMEIERSKIHIPAMFIQSNALNLTLNGEHTFDQKIDYGIKVNAGQVIWNKWFTHHDPGRKPQEAKKKGWLNMYYRVQGTIDDYETKRDKRMVSRRFKESEDRKGRIQERLIRAFGYVDALEEPSEWKDDIPEYEEEEDSDDPEFLDFEVGGNEEEEEEFLWDEEGEG